MAFRRDKAVASAEKYASKGQYDKAAREYASIVEHDPKDVRSWLLLADCLVRSGKKDEGIERYLKVAKFYQDDKQHQKAVAVYRQIIQLDPQRVDAKLACAGLFAQLRQTGEAAALYEAVAQRMLKAGNGKEALALYVKVAELDSSQVGKRLRVAELYSRERMVAEAVDQFRIAADYLRAEKRIEEHVRVAERLLYHDKAQGDVICDLADSYLQLKQPRRALVKLNTLLQGKPDDPRGLRLLARTFKDMGKLDKASSVILELAKGHRARGEKDEAIAVLKGGLDWDRGNVDIRNALASMGIEPETSGVVDIDVAATELEEIEEIEEIEELDDIELIDEDDATPEMVEDEPSLTEEVLSEVGEVVSSDDLGDFDKMLFEARVLVKYRLFEHALSHVDTVLEQSPEHPAALELSGDILAQMGRSSDAADVHVRMAQQVADHDPQRARKNLEAAVAAVPDHPEATRLLRGMGAGQPEPQADPSPSESTAGLELDLGDDIDFGEGMGTEDDDAFGVIDFEDEDTAVTEAPKAPGAVLEELDDASDDFAISVDDSPEEEAVPEPLNVEDRFGLDTDGLSVASDMPDSQGFSEEDLDVDTDLVMRPAERAGAEADAVVSQGLDLGSVGEDEPDEVGEELEFDLVDDEVGESPAAEAKTDWPDIAEDVEELEFFLAQGLEDDAVAAYEDLNGRHPGHPALHPIAVQLGLAKPEPEPESKSVSKPPARPAASAAPQRREESPSGLIALGVDDVALDEPEDSGASRPLLNLDEDDDEANDYLAAIFGGEDDDDDDDSQDKVTHSARADIAGSADAGTHYDLGTAYRGMGLASDALAEFEKAAADPEWRARALIMTGHIHRSTGDAPAAIEALQEALEAARNDDERSESAYELGLILEEQGNREGAAVYYERVSPGFRDRDDKLAELKG